MRSYKIIPKFFILLIIAGVSCAYYSCISPNDYNNPYGYIPPVVSDTSNKILLNEILANPPSGGSDYIEIYNRDTTNSIDIGGYSLIDDDPTHAAFVIPAGTVIQKDTFAVFTNGTDFSFGLGSGGDAVNLRNSSGALIDSYVFGATSSNRSVGRLPDGGEWNNNLTPTKGLRNTP